jgi:hypothetical protein
MGDGTDSGPLALACATPGSAHRIGEHERDGCRICLCDAFMPEGAAFD